VIVDLAEQGVEEVLVAGDLVGRGPQGTGVVERVVDLGWPALRGNHEDYLLAFRRDEIPEHWQHTRSWAAARWMAAELSTAAADYLAALPLQLTPDDGPDLLVVHGTPAANTAGLGPWSPDSELSTWLEQIDSRILICAHTHRPMHRILDGGEVINVGAVGLPFNGDRRAQYAILERTADSWTVEFRQVAYDLDEIFSVYRRSGFLEAGGVTARLLQIELERALPHLVPFIAWRKAHEVPADDSSVDRFLTTFRGDLPLADFFRGLPDRGAGRFAERPGRLESPANPTSNSR